MRMCFNQMRDMVHVAYCWDKRHRMFVVDACVMSSIHSFSLLSLGLFGTFPTPATRELYNSYHPIVDYGGLSFSLQHNKGLKIRQSLIHLILTL